MPSSKNPAGIVHPGPGKLSNGVATASSFIFPGGGGGGGAAIHAHIIDPTDAHMASAIGIPETDPVTGAAILASAGGPIDGESVLDFIVAAKDLFPIRPNVLGYARPGVPNSAVPDWGVLAETVAVTGGFTRGTEVVPTHFLTDQTTALVGGKFYPADRGVLALYYTTGGDLLDAANTTLEGALWLSSVAVPLGIPDAGFDEALREGPQADHLASGMGLDTLILTHRMPYLKAYSGFYSNYDSNFYRYQLAQAGTALSIPPGDAGSWILVHWRETYAKTLTSIEPLAMSTHLSAGYCYSAVPVAGDFDNNEIRTLTRHNVYQDLALVSPTQNALTNVISSDLTHATLSGVTFYDASVQWGLDIAVNGLLSDCYYTGTVAEGGPAGFESALNPMTIDFWDFGGTILEVPFQSLRNPGNAYYSLINPPYSGDVNRYQEPSIAIPSASYASPIGGYGILHGTWHKPLVVSVPWAEPTRYLFNSYPQGVGSASTETYEPFTDERFRYKPAAGLTAATRVEPTPGDHHNPAVTLVIGDGHLQVIGHQLVYPHADLSVGYLPVGPDYAAVLAGDAPNALRSHLRAFNTGIPRNTGKLRIRGVSYSQIQSSVANPSAIRDGHAGGVIILIKVPGQTGWLDLGRDYGVPGLNMAVDFTGCKTAVMPNTAAMDFTVSFNTGSATANNGAGEFPLFVQAYLFKNGSGELVAIDDITWEAP